MPDSSKKTLKVCLLSATVLCALFLSAPVQAQLPWGYSPITGSNSWLWLSRSLYSPSYFLFRNGSYGAGSYLVNTLAYQTAYGVSRGVNAVGRQKAMKQYYQNANNGINAPVVDQISAAPWYYPPRGVNGMQTGPQAPQTPAVTASDKDPFADPNAGTYMPIPATFNDDAPSTGPIVNPLSAPIAALPPEPTATTKSKKIPAAAPDFRSPKSEQKSEPAVQQTASSSNPFAQAFVDHVNAKFDGDIARAFADKQTTAYARALGFVETSKISELPEDRLLLIHKILQDPSEDALTKVNTIRLLIKH